MFGINHQTLNKILLPEKKLLQFVMTYKTTQLFAWIVHNILDEQIIH